MTSDGFIGAALVSAGIVDADGLARGAAAQSEAGGTLGRALAMLGLADEAVVAQTIASALHLDYLAGEVPSVPADVAALLPADFCRKRGAAPLGYDGNTLRIAVINGADYSVLQDVQFRTGRKVAAVVVTESWFETFLASLFPAGRRTASYDMLREVHPTGEVERAPAFEYELVDPKALTKEVQLPPVVRLVNLILSDAATAGASDIHIEPHETFLQVRQRVDGLLRDVLTIPHHLQDSTISRLKIISGMDIAERRRPQDGRSRLRFDGRRIDLRVSTLPTQFGEKVVIRLLDADHAVMPMEQVGFAPDTLKQVRSFLSRPQGMILVTGPTGSGKTSTLYAALNSLKSQSNNIITLEDPVELRMPGVNQMQVNARAGVTFASGLRSILRQDPNVILVGEIRDHETAEIAMGAAQTGHLLLSTLHTNDATATVTRLFDLGIQPFLVASSLVGVVAQRLVRRPCPQCVEPATPGAETIEKAGGAARMPADARWVTGRGCDSCGRTGTKGRLGIHEVFAVTDEIRDLIASRAPEHVIRRAAMRAGMRTLLEDGIEKAAQGLTTLDEVLRAVSYGGQVADAATAAPAREEPAAPAMPEAAGPRRVLIVEDSPTVATVVKYFLELEGFEVLVAENGLQGLDMALQERPEVIVSDVMMPGMSGLEMVSALRADARGANLRVLMLTSETSVERETEGLAAGADDYIAKPVEPRRLAARVKALIARAR